MPTRTLPVGTALPAVYRKLAELPGEGPLLELPLSQGDPRGTYRDAYYMLLSAYHWKRLVNGRSGFLPPTYEFLSALGQQLPDREALQDLVDLVGLRWLIVHARRLQPEWGEREHAGDIRRLADDGESVLFEVDLPQRQNLLAALRAAALTAPRTTLQGTPLTPLPRTALAADWLFAPLSDGLRPGERVRVQLTVRNKGPSVWPGWAVRPDGLVVVELCWTRVEEPPPPTAPLTLPLGQDLSPGQAATITAVLQAPAEPGDYWLNARVRQLKSGDGTSEPHRVAVTVGPVHDGAGEGAR